MLSVIQSENMFLYTFAQTQRLYYRMKEPSVNYGFRGQCSFTDCDTVPLWCEMVIRGKAVHVSPVASSSLMGWVYKTYLCDLSNLL